MTKQSRFWPLAPEKSTILLVTLMLLLLSIIKSGYYTASYGGVDLRNMTVASRMLDSGRSVYFYRWSPGEPERYLNPNVPPHSFTNAVSETPGCLYFAALFSALPYPVLKVVWTTLQYLFILSIFCYFFFQKENSPDRRWTIVVVGGLFILCTPIWFLNIERGQIYFLFAFFFTLIFLLYRNSSPVANFFAGVVIAIAIYCRPNFIFLLVPIVLVRNWRVLAGWLSAAIPLGVHAYFHRGLWAGYSAVVHEFSDLGPAIRAAENPQYNYPAVIEGAKNLTRYKTDFVCGGIHPVGDLLAYYFHLDNSYYYFGLLLSVMGVLILVFKKELAKKDAQTVILFGFLLYMTAEYIMPAPRAAYNLILWVFPVLLFLQRPRFPPAVYVLLIVGLCFINGAPFYFPFIHDLGEALLVCCLWYYLKAPEINTPPGSSPSSC